MRTRFLVVVIFVFSFGNIYSQESPRIDNIRNHLEILKIETPGLSEKLNINISQTSLSNFLLAISKVHKININVSPELKDINVVNNFSNVSVENVLIFLVKEFDLTIEFTGNILSVKLYIPPPVPKFVKEIIVDYDLSTDNISLDLKNNKLEDVFRKIMDVSGKNLLFSPQIESKPLSLYINDVPFDVALEKLAEGNNLILNKSRDGFYVFKPAYKDSISDISASGIGIRKGENFYYRILDTINNRLEVDFKNVPISDIIYSVGNDLDLDLFTASSLDNIGYATVKADDISFDLLLYKIFQSNVEVVEQDSPKDEKKNKKPNFTYKKEGNIYYFGTEDQLSLKKMEIITMMHRSVQMLKDPSGDRKRRDGSEQFINGPTNFSNSNNFNSNQYTHLNQRINDRLDKNSMNDTDSKPVSITDIIPDDILAGLDIKIDKELNSFIVSGSSVKVERFKNFIKYIDKPVPVILIEVMILEVNKSAVFETGVSFGIGDGPTTTKGEAFPSTNLQVGAKDINRIIGSFNGFGALNIGNVVPDFYLNIKAMESNGNIKVLSTPRLSTLNGHKANLSSGQTTYYAVTSQTYFGSQNPQLSEITNYAPIDAELALQILPFVSGDEEITLDIQVIQSTFNGEKIADDAPPGMNSREFSSIIRMRDQDVAILGGIEITRKDDSGSGVPFLARIPVIKYLFSERRREDSNSKLNILIRPRVIK